MSLIVFETHASSVDNEAGLASGHADVPLSDTGVSQARELGERRRADPPRAVYCSDLERSWRTAALAFEGRRIPIIRDRRLREADYGELTRQPRDQIDRIRAEHIESPFPGGESYAQVVARVESFLDETEFPADGYSLIVGHRATHYALDHLLAAEPLEVVVAKKFVWRPGWEYRRKHLRDW